MTYEQLLATGVEGVHITTVLAVYTRLLSM